MQIFYTKFPLAERISPLIRPSTLPASLAVFNRPRVPADQIPESMLEKLRYSQDLEPDVLPFKDLGDLNFHESRLLVGAADEALYGIPTSRGWVCWLSASPFPPRCVHDLIDDLYTWKIDYRGEPEAATQIVVQGLLGDDVVAVDVLVGESAYSAAVGENAFRVVVPRGSLPLSEVSGFKLHLSDGSVVDALI